MSRRRPRVLIDVDDVIADFTPAALAAFNALSGLSLKPSDFPDWDIFADPRVSPYKHRIWKEYLDQPGFFANLDTLPGAIEHVHRIAMFAEVFMLTASTRGPHYHRERQQWLEKHLGIDWRHIVFATAKYTVEGDFFIDDKPSNLRDWLIEHPHGQAVMAATPFNSGSLRRWHDDPHAKHLLPRIVRTNDWCEIEAMARRLL